MKNSAKTRSDFADQRRLAGYARLPASIVDTHGVPMALANDVWHFNVAERDMTFVWASLSKNPWLVYAIKRYGMRQLQRVSPHEACNTIVAIQNNLMSSPSWQQLLETGNIDDHTRLLVLVVRDAIALKKRDGKLYQVIRLRGWYVWSAKHIPDVGFDEDFAFELSQMTIQGNEQGIAVRTEDPEWGPLDDTELGQILAALNQDTDDSFDALQERCALALCLAFGRNPANFSLLREEDFQRLVADPAAPDEWELKIPRIKKRMRPREERRSELVSEKLRSKLSELITRNAPLLYKLPKDMARPLFVRSTPRSVLLNGPMREWAFHLTAQEYTALVKRAVERYGLISCRTGKRMRIAVRRFRYTLATNLVRLGVGAAQLAEILDHSDTQSVKVYYDTKSRIVEQLDIAIAERMAPIIDAFRGKIIASAAEAMNGDDLSKRILLPADAINSRPHSACELGVCGLHDNCTLQPPFSCYDGCKKFQPFRDGPHETAVEFMLERRRELEGNVHQRRLAAQLDRTILAAVQVIQEIGSP